MLLKALKVIFVERRMPWKLQALFSSIGKLWLRCLALLSGGKYLARRIFPKTVVRYRPGSMDEYIIAEVFTRGVYPFEQFALTSTSTVVDVGTQIGCFTLKACETVTDGKVISFEPMPDNFRVLTANIAENGLTQVTARQEGVAGEAGELKLYLSDANTGMHSLRPKPSNKYISIHCTTLPQVMDEEGIGDIDLLKLDCEGAEYGILYNTPDAYLQRIKQIIMEYHHFPDVEDNIEKLTAFLEEKGFVTIFSEQDEYHTNIGTAFFRRS